MGIAAATTVLPPHSSERLDQYLTFELAGQQYGVPIERVQEIKGWEKPTQLPYSPDYVQGVVNLRGAVVPIIDVRRRFGLGEALQGRTGVVIVIRVDGAARELTAGLLVDAVCDVCSIDAASLRPPPAVSSSIDVQFVCALAIVGERMLVLLDVGRLMAQMWAEPPPSAQPL